jgi:hypothetical protein
MWSIALTDSQRDALSLLLYAQGELGSSLAAAREALDFARWDDLPEAQLPWDRVSTLAGVQGCGEADVVWDLANGMPPRNPQHPRAAVRVDAFSDHQKALEAAGLRE